MEKTILNKMNKYLINKKESIYIESSANDILGTPVNPVIVLGMAANLDRWGYVLSDECLKKLMTLTEESVVGIYNELINTLKEIKGDDVDHNTLLFKNFPDSCRTMTPEDLSDTRFVSYYAAFIDDIFGTNYYNEIEWDGEQLERTADVKHDNLRTINLATEADFKKMLNNMLSSRMSLSEYDKEILNFGIENFGAKDIIPKEIPFKENWAYIIKKAIKGEIDYDFRLNTMTDFIRVCVVLSDGDLSLANKPKFRTFTNQERKLLSTKLNLAAKYNKEVFIESLCNSKNQRLFYNVLLKGWHIDLKSSKYKALNEAWERSNKIYSKLSLAEQAIEKKDFLEAGKQFAKAGDGYLIRHANSLMEKIDEKDKFELLSLISASAEKTVPSVLLNAKTALEDTNVKVAFIKGSASKIHAYENKNNISEKNKKLLSQVYDAAIMEQLKDMPSLGVISLDERLKDCPMPFNQRANNGKNRAVERGTRLPANSDKPIVRAFVYKKCYQGGFYDLSASLLNDTFGLVNQISWTQLKVNGIERPLSLHSGDNPNSEQGCTEFIDIDKEAIRQYSEKMKEEDPNKEIRYVAFQVLAWNGVRFDDMERCFFGVMERDNPASDKVTESDLAILKAAGEDISEISKHEIFYYQLNPEQLKLVKDYKPEIVFDPATVEYRYDLTGNALTKITMMYDIKEEKFIFVDLNIPNKVDNPFEYVQKAVPATVSLEDINLYAGSETPILENYVNQTALICHSIVDMKKPNIYDFVKLYAKSTNTRIATKDDETINVAFSIDRTGAKNEITPFDTDELAKLITISKQKSQNIEH